MAYSGSILGMVETNVRKQLEKVSNKSRQAGGEHGKWHDLGS